MPVTARIYTDLSLFTCDPMLGRDATRVFNYITGYATPDELEALVVSPLNMKETLIDLIGHEMAAAAKGKPAAIWAKMNSLVDPAVIDALYRASQWGVRIELVVRGICCLRPGIPGLSENIRVRSIIGRFLEHTRVYYFHHEGEERVYCSSADWMDRNLFNRVETCFPINQPALKKRIIEQGLELYLRDNTQAWLLAPEGDYHRATPAPGEAPCIAQQTLLTELTGGS